MTEPTESDLLRQSWERCEAADLDRYLVAGVEDPRINVQSILSRAFLCDALFPEQYTRLIEEELRFGFVMTWLLTQLDRGAGRADLAAAVRAKRTDICPAIVLDAADRLQHADAPVADYVAAALQDGSGGGGLAPDALDAFAQRWRRELEPQSHAGFALFEPACGSANDFRHLAACGLARFVRYTGIDIAPKNIANAQRRFPAVDFRVGDLQETGLPAEAFDFSLVHDLFEHLSPAAMERAIRELLRVTRREVWLHFFNAANIADHQVREVDAYHWNTLSIGRLLNLLEESAAHVEVISIAEFARTKFGFHQYYNPHAYTLIATR